MSDPGRPVVDLPLQQLAIRTNYFHPPRKFIEFKKEEIEQSIPQRFEKVAHQYPERLAIKMGDRRLTYGQLNQIANRIGHIILEKRPGGSEPIALFFEHGIDGIAAIFGVLKTGKFYVALDPSLPERRINYILDDCETPLIVTNNRNLTFALKLANDRRVVLNSDDVDQTVGSDNVGLSVSAESPGAIIYTSGSTGEPKGVLETHRYRLYETMIRTNEALVCPDDRLSLLHSVTFASALVNLFQALLNGASLFPFDLKSKGVYSLSKWLRAEQITILHMPPILFRQFAQSLSGEDKFPNLRVVHLSGAPITACDFDLYRSTFAPDAVFAFHMGATETALICSAVTDQTFSFPKDGAPVGYPAKGKQILLLNNKGEEVGSGDVGEIAVKSIWLADGYWRNPELTKAKFLPDPSGGDERTYLTGDLGRMLPDGFLIHLGRKDFMVKIRGYRVDISEIERALLEHRQIKDAAVVAWDREPDEKYLVAYVAPRENPPPANNHPSASFVEFKKEEVGQSIPDRFERIVRSYPDWIAVKTANHVLTYAELNAMANRVARAILAQQGTEAALVGLLFEKGAPLMAAMLGVLKAGKFFVLLDPSFPQARLATLLEDSQATLVLTNRQNVSLAKKVVGSRPSLVEFESIHGRISAEDLKLDISPKAFASIVYTSGSTGQPKGVLWDHRYLLHCILLRTNENYACDHDRIALLSSGTGNAVTNIFLALLNGAALLPFDVQKEGVTRLASWLLQERISICPISSPLFRNLCETLTGEERFPDLRLIRLRSETVYKTDVDIYKKYFSSNCTFLTGLSSGESGQLTTYLINHNTEIAGDEVPVGYAVEDKEILLLDDAGKEVGFNRVGEIAVRSRYLSLGYWRRPDLTKAKFKPEPEGSDKRLYLTGDLGLMLPDGCLIHKGRKDFRVKIRGYGVEIAEVEKVLRDHAALSDAVVVARKNESDETRLVAYFTSLSQPSPTVSELRGFLKSKLPDYMIPSAFVGVDAIPLTPNGKVDRRALPDPKNSRPKLNTPFAAPRTSKEQELVKIWTEVLDLDQIGVHDNFFDLGGHSLLATRVLSRIRDDLQVELPLSRFFETPTVAALAGCIERARPPQDGAEALLIQPALRDGQLLLSFAQQRLWFLDQLEPGGNAYNLFSVAELTGPLNVTALERSFNEIIRRHEALRTVFKTVDGKPLQIVLSSMTIKVPVVDLREIVSDTERESEIRLQFSAEAQRPFDLARGPLLRVTLLRLTEDQYMLLLAMHHIVFDGWSRGILAQELSVIYEAFSSGRLSSLPPLPIQYADFAQWQRQWLQGQVLEAQLAYWKKRLDAVPTLQLPTDRPRPAVQSFRGARQWLMLPQTLSQSLRTLSRQEGVTLFMTLLAAFQTLLYRYTRQNDIVIGSPIAGRNRREIEGLIGFFLNMLILRADLSGDPTFRELLARVREVCLEAYAHQDLPFEKLVEELHPERDLSHNPLFQVTFAFQNTPRFPLALAGVAANDLEIDSGTARFDLHLFIEEQASGLRGYVDYNTDLFDAATIERMLSHFQTQLEGIVANPDEPIGSLPLLTASERHQLLVEWNDTKKDYPKDKCIHELFEAQAERTPNAVAVVFEDKQLTYRELNQRANQLAHYLRKLGVGPETLVGICTERSLEMVVGLLGILKAGGAYVPLDSSYPPERLDFMLQDAQARVLLTQQRLVKELFEDRRSKPVLSEAEGIEDSDPRSSIPGPQLKVVCLDTDRETIAAESKEDPVRLTRPENLAYVIYTSGSTGRPKGVAIAHHSTISLSHWARTVFTSQDLAGVLASTSICFDLSVFELFVPLSWGGKIILAENILHLPALPAAMDVKLINTVPSAMVELLRVGGVPASVRTVNLAGELLRTSLVKQIYEQGKIERVFDLYGPSEDTTYSTFALRSSSGVATIGRPIANTQIYLLDSHLQPVPVGIAGELHIGGDGLVRCYLNRPDITAEKFIPNPFTNEPGARLYKTGDLACYLPDGNIEFLGRIDNQVKIRGFRIELGEIEALLTQHPAVRQAVAVAREDVPGENRLVAYIVPNTEQHTTIDDLRTFLKSKLPEYMVPSAFVVLDTLPLTPNRKVDRRALPTPRQARPELRETLVAPRTPVETLLSRIWAEVLKLEQIGVHDNFFELGGHSLLATQVISRMRETFQLELPLRALFENPTVGSLAAQVAQTQASKGVPEKMADVLADMESLSDEEARCQLAQQSPKVI